MLHIIYRFTILLFSLLQYNLEARYYLYGNSGYLSIPLLVYVLQNTTAIHLQCHFPIITDAMKFRMRTITRYK